MAKVDLHFVNGSQPALSADNMNKIVDGVNENYDDIGTLFNRMEGLETVDHVAREQIARVDSKTTAALSNLSERITSVDTELQEVNSSLSESITNNSKRIDNLVVSGGDSPVEVIDAHVGADNTTYTTLKGRLDSENRVLTSNVEALECVGWTIPSGMPIKDISKVDRVNLSSLNWTLSSSGLFYSNIIGKIKIPSNASVKANIYCDLYTTYAFNDTWVAGKPNGICIGANGSIGIHDTNCADANALKTKLVNTYLYYEKSTPTTYTDGKEKTEILTHNVDDIEYLGWSVPSDMPIQNYKDANGVFHQRVGRVDLGSLNINKSASPDGFRLIGIPNAKQYTNSEVPNVYCSKYKSVKYHNFDDKTITFFANTSSYYIRDNSFDSVVDFKTAMQGVYLYYELATEKTYKEGEEKNEELNNLLNDVPNAIRNAIADSQIISGAMSGNSGREYATPINCNKGAGGGCAIALTSYHNSNGDSTGSKVSMLRFGYNGNHVTEYVISTAGVAEYLPLFSCDSDGTLVITHRMTNAVSKYLIISM